MTAALFLIQETLAAVCAAASFRVWLSTSAFAPNPGERGNKLSKTPAGVSLLITTLDALKQVKLLDLTVKLF
jgi:hypothetical protein